MHCPSSLALPTQPDAAPAGPVRFVLFRTIEAAARDWDAAAPAHDLFLQRPYLSVLESNPPQGMRFCYLVFYLGEQPVGVALCQIKYFKGDINIAELDVPRKDPCFFGGLAQWFKKWVAGKAAADILICGNMLLTGDHGFYFDPQKVRAAEAAAALESALGQVQASMEREGLKMPFILVKDVPPQQAEERQLFIEKGFTEFDIQPNMVLELDGFADFDGYLSAMTTKYRTRAKRAFKKAEEVEKRELSHADIQREMPVIHQLYKDIANNAGFNMVDLNERYLAALKQGLGERYRMFGCYKDGKMIAFYTTICNNKELEAHFLGYSKALNHDYQLYLNILYDIVQRGFDCRCERIVFARTALEIKSSVGAVAEQLFCYLRHQHTVANKFVPALLDYLKPVETWQPRHPFREA
jgi:hypothetical protein